VDHAVNAMVARDFDRARSAARSAEQAVMRGENLPPLHGLPTGIKDLEDVGGLRTTYEPVDERLASGTLVHRGTRIGVLSAGPGHCTPRGCLHWGAISGLDYRDPLSLLGFGRPILLPLG